jgi:hypothetical protein
MATSAKPQVPKFTGSVKTGEDDVWEYFDTFVDSEFTTKSLRAKPRPPFTREEAFAAAEATWRKLRPEWYK